MSLNYDKDGNPFISVYSFEKNPDGSYKTTDVDDKTYKIIDKNTRVNVNPSDPSQKILEAVASFKPKFNCSFENLDALKNEGLLLCNIAPGKADHTRGANVSLKALDIKADQRDTPAPPVEASKTITVGNETYSVSPDAASLEDFNALDRVTIKASNNKELTLGEKRALWFLIDDNHGLRNDDLRYTTSDQGGTTHYFVFEKNEVTEYDEVTFSRVVKTRTAKKIKEEARRRRKEYRRKQEEILKEKNANVPEEVRKQFVQAQLERVQRNLDNADKDNLKSYSSAIAFIGNHINTLRHNYGFSDEELSGLLQLYNDHKNLLESKFGVEYVDLIGTEYDEGMNLTANFNYSDEVLNTPDDIDNGLVARFVSSVRQPQINKDGKMVQAADIVVSDFYNYDRAEEIPSQTGTPVSNKTVVEQVVDQLKASGIEVHDMNENVPSATTTSQTTTTTSQTTTTTNNASANLVEEFSSMNDVTDAEYEEAGNVIAYEWRYNGSHEDVFNNEDIQLGHKIIPELGYTIELFRTINIGDFKGDMNVSNCIKDGKRVTFVAPDDAGGRVGDRGGWGSFSITKPDNTYLTDEEIEKIKELISRIKEKYHKDEREVYEEKKVLFRKISKVIYDYLWKNNSTSQSDTATTQGITIPEDAQEMAVRQKKKEDRKPKNDTEQFHLSRQDYELSNDIFFKETESKYVDEIQDYIESLPKDTDTSRGLMFLTADKKRIYRINTSLRLYAENKKETGYGFEAADFYNLEHLNKEQLNEIEDGYKRNAKILNSLLTEYERSQGGLYNSDSLLSNRETNRDNDGLHKKTPSGEPIGGRDIGDSGKDKRDGGVTSDRQELRTSDGRDVLGYVHNGEIWLDFNNIDAETPIHEYTHVWDNVVRKKNPELWKRGVELMKQITVWGTTLWDEVANDENYGKKWERQGKSEEDIEFLIASEVHARLVGIKGKEKLASLEKKNGKNGIIAQLKQWLKDCWKEVAQTFGVWSKDQLDALTLEDFENMTLRDFAQGVKLNEAPDAAVVEREQPAPQPTPQPSDNVQGGGGVRRNPRRVPRRQTDTPQDARTSLRTPTDRFSRKVDIPKEIQTLRQSIPQLAREDAIIILDSLMQVGRKGPLAQGVYRRGIMTISRRAVRGTVYHEAFHSIFDTVLDDQTKAALLDETKRLYNVPTDIQAEEILADQFKEHMLGIEQKSFLGKVAHFFHRLMLLITNHSRIAPVAQRVFNQVTSGAYAKTDFSNKHRSFEEEKIAQLSEIGYSESGIAILDHYKNGFDSIDSAQRAMLEEYGITEEMFDMMSPGARENLFVCL